MACPCNRCLIWCEEESAFQDHLVGARPRGPLGTRPSTHPRSRHKAVPKRRAASGHALPRFGHLGAHTLPSFGGLACRLGTWGLLYSTLFFIVAIPSVRSNNTAGPDASMMCRLP
ncbi:Uncharacterized protein HZ326_4362 [Fusarium oxysporum f. sp. albedinis]|nr:Uncharacterized protein HZ326_4362 [Fusarium oxysporum f. sp. albedinis]